MSNPIQARWPIGGVSEDFGYSDQPGLTSQDALNVRGLDPVTGRLRGAVRSGTRNYVDLPTGTHKVARLCTVTTANTNQQIVSLGDALTQTWKKTNTTSSDTLGIQCGTQGDVYTLDGSNGVMKNNADGALMWKLTLATPDKNHSCRALLVDSGTPNDAGTDLVLVGVSYGGDSTKAKFWAYIQQNDNKVEKLWEISPGGYVEEFAISKDKLYVLLNYPDRNRSYVRVYDDYLTNTPTQQIEWTVPYPAHSLASSPKDGYIFTASAPSSDRDTFPGHPKASWASEDWSILDLSNYKERIWANLDASIEGTVSVQPRNLAYPNEPTTVDSAPPPVDFDGGNVLAWIDASGQGRNFYQSAEKLPRARDDGLAYIADHAASRGAIYKKNGAPNGKPCLHFDGATCGMISEKPSSRDKANGSDNLSVLPSYKGAQFACFMVVRASIDEFRRVLLCQGGDTASNSNVSRFVAINSDPGFGLNNVVAQPSNMPGEVHLWEPSGVAGDATLSSNAPPAPSGFNGYPLGGGLTDSGLAVITWICDGGIHDVPNTATRSQFRINGHPCDRWQSAAFSSLMPTQLGYLAKATPAAAAFSGDVMQILVIHDWFNASGTQQALLGSGDDHAMRYPDDTWNNSQDSDLERIEGMLAHKWGMAHELEGGRVGFLTITGLPANNETLTIDGTTYTFRTVAAGLNPTTPNQILIGANYYNTAVNIVSAVNKTGEAGVDYTRGTVVNATFKAFGPMAMNATVHYAVGFRTRSSNYHPGAVLSETMTNASFPSSPYTPAASVAGGGGNLGWYPHPFYIDRTDSTVGGPPRSEGASTISKYWMLRSPYGILAAWDPVNGKAKSVITSNYDGAGTGFGGIGYAVRVASTGEVYSAGPRQAAVSALTAWSSSAISADAIDIRKIGWESEAFAPASTVDYWVASLQDVTYQYPRLAVDKFDNVYFPAADGSNYSLYGIKRQSLGSGTPEALFSYTLPLAPYLTGYCVAVDPTYPNFTGYTSLQRAEHILLGTGSSGTTRKTIYKLRALDVTPSVGAPRTVTLVSICGSQISKVTTSTVTASTGPWVETTRNFVDATEFMGKLYIVDGQHTLRYNPVDTETETANTSELFIGTSSGGVPQRCSLICTWNGSLVLARQAENPNQYFISAIGEPGNFDTSPYTLTAAQAVLGSDGSAGLPPDIINALISYNDDLLLIGGDHSIWRITGRPSPGGSGEIHLVSDSIGIAFGRAWCKSPTGIIYFFGSRGGVYRMAPGGIPEPLPGDVAGRNKIERRLQAIDLSAYTVQMAWNDRDKGFHIIVCPFGDGGTVVEHYFWEEAKGAWWPDQWAVSTIQPTCVTVLDGDAEDDRAVLFGCEDGYVRKLDGTYNLDDTYPIGARVLIGPLAPKDVGTEVIFSRLQAVMANDQDSRPFLNIYVTDRADYLGKPVWSGQIQGGRNPFINGRWRGAFVYLEIVSSDSEARWAYEQISLDYAEPAGIKRSAGV